MTEQTTTYNSPGRECARSILLGAVILAAGVIIGAGMMFITLSGRDSTAEPERFAEHMIRRLDSELELSEPQRRRLEPILQDHYRALEDIRAQARPRIVEQLEQLDDELGGVLDESQLETWHGQLQRLEEHFPTFRPRRGLGRRHNGDHTPGPHGQGYRRNSPGPDPNELSEQAR